MTMARQKDVIVNLSNWPDANREAWEVSGSIELYERACQEVDTRLASYAPIETDPEIDAAMRQIVMDGLEKQEELPILPPPPEKKAKEAAPGRRGRAGRRRRAAQ